MFVDFAIRPDYLTNRGGDTFQLLKTKEYIEQFGDIDVNIITSPEQMDEGIDILHIFNLQNNKFAFSMIKVAKNKENCPKIVLSPIIWNFGDARYVNKMMRLFHNISLVRKMKFLASLFDYYDIIRNKNINQQILNNTDVILPNSDEEGNILKRKYKNKAKEFDIPNCIDIHISNSQFEEYIPKNCVLQVGRIEPTKNQLSLLQAMMSHQDIPLVFVGKQNKRKQYYINQLKRLAKKRGNTYFVEEVPQEQLGSFYKSAKVHVLPSFRESPGLVSLEALYYHCNIVVSDSRYCPINYYKFDKYGYICNPYSVKSIEDAVLKAYEEKQIILPDGYFDFYNYKNAAKMTKEAYLSVLN